MKKIYLLFVIMLLGSQLNAQNNSFQWAKSIGDVITDNAYVTSIDSLGNVYVAGTFEGIVDFDPGAGTYTLASVGSGDNFILKLDTNGDFLWAKSFGSTINDDISEIILDKLGNIYTTGFFKSAIDFDPGVGTYSLSPAAAGEAYVLKLDAFGTFLWVDRMGGGTSSVSGTIIEVDNSGDVLVGGNFSGTADFDPGVTTYTLNAPLSSDNFIVKLNSSGQFIWAKRMGGNSNNQSYGIAVDKAGNILTCGSFYYNTDFDPGPGIYTLTATGSQQDMYISKLDASGNFVWAKRIGSANEDIAKEIVIDTAGSVYITGNFQGTVDFDPNAGVFNLIPGGGGSGIDAFILKLNSSGNLVWAKNIGGVNTESSNSIALDSIGNIYTTGYFRNTADFNPNAGVNNLTSNCVNCEDMFISKLDSTGSYVWARNIGNSHASNGSSIMADKYGGVFACGQFRGALDFDPGSGVSNITSSGGSNYYDGFILKLGPCFNIPAAPVNATPPANQTICANNATTLTATSSGSINWYATPTSTMILGTGNSFATTTLTSGVYNYYAEANTCTVSLSRTAITVTVIPSPTITVNSGSICNGQSFTMTPGGASTYTLSSGSAIVSPTTTTTYTVIGTGTNGCTNSAIGSVTVNPLPTFTLSGPSNAITCLNPSTSFTVNTVLNTILWTGPGTINPAPTVATPFVNTIGIYTVTVTNGYYCSNTGTVEVVGNVTVPVVNLSAMQTVFCSGGNTAILANSTPTTSVSYLWNTSATTQSISVSPTVTTVYTATVTDNTNGCYASNSTTVTVYPLPILTVTGTNTVCLGTSTGFIALGAMTYTWNTGQTTSSINVNPIITTTYTVWGINMNGCMNSQTISVTVDNTCTDVWPGDANSDGTADNLDVLELGLHFTQVGASRAATSNNWQPYFANNWTGTITNGKNLNHSDCNGDGTIDANDTLAIYNNYGLTHTFKPVQTNTVNPQLSIVPDQPMVTKGSWGTASIYLGDVTTLITNINGVAFTVDFDNTLIEPSNVWIEYQNSFIDASQNLYFRKLDFLNSKLFTASTHTISNNVSGFGKIAVLHYQILSSLTSDQVLNIGVSNASQSNASGVISPLTSGTGTLMAIGASVGVKENLFSGNVLISPNPTNGLLNINFNATPQNTKIELYNSIGALVLTEMISNKNNTITMSDLSSGMYFMKVLENGRVVSVKKVIKE